MARTRSSQRVVNGGGKGLESVAAGDKAPVVTDVGGLPWLSKHPDCLDEMPEEFAREIDDAFTLDTAYPNMGLWRSETYSQCSPAGRQKAGLR